MLLVVKPVRILNSCLGVLLFAAKACRYNRLLGRFDLLFSYPTDFLRAYMYEMDIWKFLLMPMDKFCDACLYLSGTVVM